MVKAFYCPECDEFKYGWQIQAVVEGRGYYRALTKLFCKKCGCSNIKNVNHEIKKLIRGDIT